MYNVSPFGWRIETVNLEQDSRDGIHKMSYIKYEVQNSVKCAGNRVEFLSMLCFVL